MENVYVAGHRGMVGSAIVRALIPSGHNLILASRSELNLLNQKEVLNFFKNHRIDKVYLAAAKVGGIYANNAYPAEFIYENLMIQSNVIHAAFLSGVKKLLFLGSSCIYPKYSDQPIREECLLSGFLESTNEPYAVAKIAGLKLCESYNRQYSESHGIDYRAIMPTNLYGSGDNYHPENSHVIPALIQRIHKAKVDCIDKVVIWGSGQVRREFLFVDDLAEACLYVMNLDKSEYGSVTSDMCGHLNVGFGRDISIKELAKLIAKTIGFSGELIFDLSKPEGTPVKRLDISKLTSFGWKAKTSLEIGLLNTYSNYIENL